MRFEPAPNMTAKGMFYHGCRYLNTQRNHYGLQHDLQHLKGGQHLDPRACLAAGYPFQGNAELSCYMPTSHKIPVDKLEIMMDVSRTWFMMKIVTSRTRPWDASLEVVDDFLVRMEFYRSTSRPYEGYYRLSSASQA